MKNTKANKLTSGIVWQGKSKIDGSPIVGIITSDSKNTKTGNMPQVWILRSDIDPITANRTGLDYAICGNCPHRGTPDNTKKSGTANSRSCYVTLQHAPLNVYRKFTRGGYPVLTDEQLQGIVQGTVTRIGAYGDGAAMPDDVIHRIRKYADGVTAYTHQGLSADNTYMQSADTLSVAQNAWKAGKRTFRIVSSYAEKQANEVICPSSKGVQCKDCGLCDGNKQAKSVVIEVHGIGAGAFRKRQG